MMAVIANRRSVMTLFSRPTDIHSHRTRLVLAEKNINIEIASILGPELPEDLMDLNPYHTVPTLVDRDLTLYDSRVIIEYLDERFPHPPLMPVDPVTRAQFRLALFRIERDWYGLTEEIVQGGDRKPVARAVKALEESILSSVEIFAAKKFFKFRTVIPSHYRTFPLLAQSAEEFAKLVAPVRAEAPEVMGTVVLE